MPAEPGPNFEALRLELSRRRAEMGLTYDALAEKSGVSRATIIAIETAKPRGRNPGAPSSRGSLESWWRLARALDTDLGSLVKALDS